MEEALGYLVRKVKRVQHGSFRQQGFFLGSGVVEAGCKTGIGARREQSGLFGSVTGAEKIPAWRCLQARRRRDAFWPFGLDQPAARKDARVLAA